MTTRIAIFCAIFLSFCLEFVPAQTVDFSQTGQVRAVVSETKTSASNGAVSDSERKFPSGDNSKLDFYFTYTASENGKISEKWIALPDDRAWSRLSNQTVRMSGRVHNDKLSNAAASPIARLPENYSTAPPATVGLYKIVAVPLTIQPTPAYEKPEKNAASLEATAEAIRDNLFNAPNSVNKFYLEASYGKFGFTGVNHPQVDVVPVTIQASVGKNCQQQIISEFTPIVRERLLQQNIDTTNGSVDLGIIIFNDTPGCPPYPFTTRGALGQRGAPNWVWMPESWFATGPAILAHEIGHALGANHTVALRCSNFNDPQTCVTTGNADDRDLMTFGGRFYVMPNNYERRRWGWHPSGAFDKPSNGFVYMFDLRSPVLPFVKDGARQERFLYRNLAEPFSGWDVYPEARRDWGQFEKYQQIDESFRLGIAVRIGHSNYGDADAISILLDPNDTPQLEDAPLRENQQLSIGGVSIKCIREYIPNSGTRVRIE